MEPFKIGIAGLVAQVQPLFGSTRDYCRAYLSGGTAEFFVDVAREDLVREQERLDREADDEGLRRRKFPDPFLERSVIQQRIADALAERGTLMLHGSTVAVDGQAYLFTAACGTGKSTHTRLWREVFGTRAVMVNDDKPFLRMDGGAVMACGSPWSGKHGLDSNICVPLKGICILRRGPENVIRPMNAEDAMEMLLHQSHAPEKVRPMVLALAEQVPLWEMECTKDPKAALVAYEAMSGAACDSCWDGELYRFLEDKCPRVDRFVR